MMSLPDYVPEQVALYQGEHLLTHDVLAFDPQRAARGLQHPAEVIAVDLGGDKIRRADYAIAGGKLCRSNERALQSRGGEGYLAFLEAIALEAAERGVRVGISSATRLEGTVITRTVNLPHFFDEFRVRYGADYARLFPQGVAVANDTISGICGASTLLAGAGETFGQIAFVICGSGLGASVIHEGRALHVEAAHVPLVDALNPLGQITLCNVPGKEYVCLERVTAGRAGIEDLAGRLGSPAADGIALAAAWEAGDGLATTLYATSALALAHATAGVMERFGGEASGPSVVVYHGGMFEIERYRPAVADRLAAFPMPPPRVVFSRDLSANACLDGAAILAGYDHDVS